MAYMVPEVIRTSAAAGERMLFRTLKEHLADDYLVYYEPEMEGIQLDFVIIGPDLGVVVLEVWDYTRSALLQVDQDEWQLHTSAGRIEAVTNPYKQAKDKARHVGNRLKQDPLLAEENGRQLRFRCGFGTVFTRMRQEDFDKYQLYDVISPEFVLCRDEADPDEASFSADLLIEKIHGMFTVWSRSSAILSHEEIQAIRSCLQPEVRISAEYRKQKDDQNQLLLSLHPIKAADLHSENRASPLAATRRNGLGSTRQTSLLAHRAKALAKQHPDWKILVLSNNHSLSVILRDLIDELMDEPEDLFDWLMLEEQKDQKAHEHNVEIYHFHEWLFNQLNVRAADVADLTAKLERKEAILPSYDVILIDEGQAFDQEWLRLLHHMLRPGSQQASHESKDRSRIVSMNYRNSAQIIQFAWSFYEQHSLLRSSMQEGSIDGVDIIPPHSTRRKGPEPAILRCNSLKEEMEAVATRIQHLHHERKVAYAEMAILYRVKNNYHMSYIDLIRKELGRQNLPFHRVADAEAAAGTPQAKGSSNDRIQILAVDQAKGLDFRAVFIVNAENMPLSLEEAEEREVSLFYLAMTRALDWLCISYSGDSKFTLYLDELQQQRKHKKTSVKHMG
jgi:hypothetical protein